MELTRGIFTPVPIKLSSKEFLSDHSYMFKHHSVKLSSFSVGFFKTSQQNKFSGRVIDWEQWKKVLFWYYFSPLLECF